MNAIKFAVLSTAAVVFFTGCCLKLNDLTPGATYNVGSTITTSGTVIQVEQFQWANGTWTSNGYARADASNFAGGSGNELRANNANLNFQLSYPLQKLTFKFADLGGNENIKVNNDFRNVQNLVGLNNTTIGGVQATVSAVQRPNGWFGDMVLEGPITGFTIGGQEFWIDEICPTR